MATWKTALLGLGVAVLLYAVLGFFAAPPLVKRLIERQAGEALGRSVSVSDVRINPFLLTAHVAGFSVAGLAGAPPALELGEIAMDLSASSLLRRAIVLSELRLESPVLRVARTAPNRYDVSDILDRLLAGPKNEGRARLVLQQFELRKGTVDFDDRPESTRHAVRDIDLVVPFLSSLPDAADQDVETTFSAVVNGGRMNLKGRARPFSNSHETAVELLFSGVELPRYVEYAPFPVGVRLESGILEGALKIGFRDEKNRPALGVSGRLGLARLAVRDRDGQPLIEAPSASVQIASFDLFARSLVLDRVSIESPRMRVRRAKDGLLNVAALAAPESAEAEAAPAPAGTPAFSFELRHAAIEGGELEFTDEAISPGFKRTLRNLSATAEGLSNRREDPAQGEKMREKTRGKLQLTFETSAGENAKAEAAVSLVPLLVEGRVEAAGLSVPGYGAYYAAGVPVAIENGMLTASAGFRVAPEGVVLKDVLLRLRDLRIVQAGREPARLAELELGGGELDLQKRTLAWRTVSARDGAFAVLRDKAGALALPVLLDRQQKAEAKSAEAGPGWTVTVAKTSIEGLAVGWEDALAPVKLDISPVSLAADNLTTRAGAASAVRASLSLGGKGSLALAGQVQAEPLRATLEVDAKALPIEPFQPYFAGMAGIALGRGELSARGTVSVQDGKYGYQGSAEAAGVSISDRQTKDPLLEWGSLAFSGIRVASSPLALHADEVVLADFYSRLVVLPEGRFNLQQVTLPEDKRSAAAPPANQAPAPRPPVTVNRLTLKSGTVDFDDRFIKPNFSAHLTQVGGEVLGLSADPGTRAKVQLNARIDQTAPVTISGTVNPLSGPLYLDVTAAVRGYDLNLLSPYAVKYIGYGIEKGKLSLDLRYRVEDRKLEAQNRIFLDQLTFGSPVESPTALKLPVLLAVKLLQNSRGEIDVNVPISGSLDDPQFSMGEIVMKVIGNMIVNTITAPFRLLGSLFGGGQEELSWIAFEPGAAGLSAEAEKKAETLAKALADRPGLTLEIAARLAPAVDGEGLRQRALEAKLQPGARGAAPATLPPRSSAEYLKLLRQAYARDLQAAGRDLPTGREPGLDEMEKALLAKAGAGAEDLQALAARRGQAVQQSLVAKGISAERLFLVSPSEAPAGGADAPGEGTRKSAPASRVDLYLK